MHVPNPRIRRDLIPLIACLCMHSTVVCAEEIKDVPTSKRGRVYQNALKVINESISKNPRDAAALNARANWYLDNLEFDLAIRDETESLKIKETPEALSTRAEAYRQLNKHELSLKDWTRAVQLQPTKAELFHHRARCQRSLGLIDKALEDMNRAVKLRPDAPRNFDERAVLYRMKKNFPAAIKDLQTAVRLSPIVNRYLNLGDTQMEAKDYKGAVETYSNAIKLDSTLLMAIYAKAKACDAAGMKDEATKLRARAKQIETDEIGNFRF